jgi:hypothetical protein
MKRIVSPDIGSLGKTLKLASGRSFAADAGAPPMRSIASHAVMAANEVADKRQRRGRGRGGCVIRLCPGIVDGAEVVRFPPQPQMTQTASA